jgi:phosphate transport system permease protein
MSIEVEKEYHPDPLKNRLALDLDWRLISKRWIPALVFLAALITVVVGCFSIISLSLEAYPVPLLAALCFLLQILLVDAYRTKNTWDIKVLLLSILCFAGLLVLRRIPVLVTGWELNVFVDHTLFSAAFLIIAGIPAMMQALYYFFGASPEAEDKAKYPLILLPVILTLFVYFALLGQLVVRGLATFDWSFLFKPYFNYPWPVKIFIAGDWPKWTVEPRLQIGMLNHLLGTGLLMLLTSLISLPFGVGAGVYLSEYGDSWWAKIARFTITSLRAISLLILGLTAYSIIKSTSGTPFAWITHGTFFDGYSETVSYGGSYLTAALVLSLLVIPIITRATEEGCRSLPNALREGSLALGAAEETTLVRVILPWALPNIVTATLLGCAEAAGSVAVLMFIAGRGDYGVGVFRQVTTLAYLIFDIYFGEKQFRGNMGPFQYTAGVILLIITMGLGALSIVVKRWLVRRYRGG